MKMKIYVYFLAVMLAFSLISCSNKKSTENSEQNADTETNAVIDDLSENLYDAQFCIDGVIYQLPMKGSDFDPEVFISDYDFEKLLYSEELGAAAWKKGDLRLSAMLVNPSINAAPLKDCYITSLDIENYKHNLTDIYFAKGIQLNVSTEKDIIKAFGEPTETREYDNYLYMIYETYDNLDKPIMFTINMDTDTLIAVRLQTRETLPSDYKIYSEVPVPFNYVKPTGFSDSFDCKTFCLNGEYYSLPCPVTELINNGFEQSGIMSLNPNAFVSSGAMEECIFTLYDKYLLLKIKNFSDYATYPENCYIISVEDNSYYDDNSWSMEIAPGLKIGDSEDKLLSALENEEYSTSKGVSSKGKEMMLYLGIEYDDQSSFGGTRSFSIEASEGKIISISITNSVVPTYNE